MVEYPLKSEDVRAFSLNSKISIVVLNENDNDSIKLFSLFHEIAHILRGSPGLCSIDMENSNTDIKEKFCDHFAAEFLVPYDDISKVLKSDDFINGLKSTDSYYKYLDVLVKRYGVSKHVMIIYLLEHGYISKEIYKNFKDKLDINKVNKIKFGRKNWEKVYLNRAGNLAIHEVSEAYKKKIISFYEVIEILDIKSKYATKFMEY
ncbi:MAG: ImmA/IrrE family metallo-endopeptidase [Thermoplasmata archaeon]